MPNHLSPHLIRPPCFVGGPWIDAQDGTDFAVHNPATGEVIARVARAGRAETRLAIDAAATAHGGIGECLGTRFANLRA